MSKEIDITTLLEGMSAQAGMEYLRTMLNPETKAAFLARKGKPMNEDTSKMNMTQRRRLYHAEHPDAWQWDEGESLTGVKSQAQKPAEQPAEQPAKNAFQKLLEMTPREDIEKLIEEYGDDEGFMEIASKYVAPKQEAADQEALQQEYTERYARIPVGRNRANDIHALRQEMHRKGLKELP